MLWLAPLSLLCSANGGLAAGKWQALLPALLVAFLAGMLLLRLDRKAACLARLRDGQSSCAQFCRWGLGIYLLVVAGRLLSGAVSLWTSWAGAETPDWLYLILLLSVLAYGLHRGSSAVIRSAVLCFLLLPVLATLDTLLLLPKFRWERLSLAPLDAMSFGDGFLSYLLLLLAGLPALLWYGAGREEVRGRAALGGWLCGGLYLLLLVLRDSLCQGLLTTWERYPLLRTLKMVEFGLGLNRVEYLAVLLLLALMMAGIMILAAASREMLQRNLAMKRNWSLIISVAILAAAAFL